MKAVGSKRNKSTSPTDQHLEDRRKQLKEIINKSNATFQDSSQQETTSPKDALKDFIGTNPKAKNLKDFLEAPPDANNKSPDLNVDHSKRKNLKNLLSLNKEPRALSTSDESTL